MFPPHTNPAPGTSALLVVVGDLDIDTVGALWRRASAVLASGADDLRLDLSGVTFIDATGIGVLVRIKLAADALGLTVRLSAPGRVVRVLNLAGLDRDLAAA